uniref:Coiled-coil protein 142 C-terminal domain-containing protein n=1 Tax=Photinus pyralis TaxID=7054 RepID=A0A1Y1MHN9_PHOPY
MSAVSVEIPHCILSAIISLADSLGMHITSTSWDQHFRVALVASRKPFHHATGRTFNDLLQNLVLLCNQCETTSDWILGAPLEELPVVEQIPILHRLDHSIHTTRLWAINETKRLANHWEVDKFFTITHCDIVNYLAQLSILKLNDHTADIERGGFGAHVQVCINMRAKLASEVTTNHDTLKVTQKVCIDTLASVCRMISLANLQMIFPDNQFYRRSSFNGPEKPSSYVSTYLGAISNRASIVYTTILDAILSPVLATTEDHHISNMILKIMCECWLDHIYMNKMKFSQSGAYQLLTDFASVTTWLVNCPIITQHMRKVMLKNEVLRRCEGVGRLLLRSPGEQLKMNEIKANGSVLSKIVHL